MTKTEPLRITTGRSNVSFRTSPEKGRTRLNRASSSPQAARSFLAGVRLRRVASAFSRAFSRPARLLLEELEQVRLPLGLEPLQFREGDLGLVSLGGGQAEHRLGRPLGGVVEQALVDVADLLDVERPEAQAAGLAVHFEVLERPEQVQHRPVVDRQRRSGWSVSCQVVPGLRPSRNGNRSGSNSLPA